MKIHFINPYNPKEDNREFYGDALRLRYHAGDWGFGVKTLHSSLFVPFKCVLEIWVNDGEYSEPRDLPHWQPYEWKHFLEFVEKRRNHWRRKIRVIE